MMQRVRRLGLVFLIGVLGAGSAVAQLATWDGPRVTSIAKQLAGACDAWLEAVREEPGAAELEPSARRLQEQSRALAGHLAAGKGHDETRDEYRTLKESLDDSEEIARRAPLEEPLLAAWAKVADLQRQIAPYYDPKAASQ